MFKRVIAGAAVALMLALLSACGDDEMYMPIDGDNAAIEIETDNGIADDYITDDYADDSNNAVNAIVYDGRRNFVDVRFELVSLVFRLAGAAEYQGVFTEYQRMLEETFRNFSSHPIVAYTRTIRRAYGIGFDAVFRMAIHLERSGNGWAIINNSDFLFDESGGLRRWTPENSVRFVSYLNDFYAETNFNIFFQENTEYFLDHSARFYNNVYSQINFEWFSQHGVNPDNMRIIISPASFGFGGGFGAWRYGDTPADTVVYAGIVSAAYYSTALLGLVIHEFVHSFANPIADIWYAENSEFREWANSSMDVARHPYYSTSLIWAYEYLTRAFTILYLVENHGQNPFGLLLLERSTGFYNIEYVYAMITEHEIIGLDDNLLDLIFGIEYELDETVHELEHDGEPTVTWRFVNLPYNAISLDDFPHNHTSGAFPTQTGDVIVVSHVFGISWLYIDLGSAEHLGMSAYHRMFSIFTIE